MSHAFASLYRAPQEATQAPREEFLYLACLREGTGNAPDSAVVDTEEGRIVHELPMPKVGDELHHFDWYRSSSACHGPDRSHPIIPLVSSQFGEPNAYEGGFDLAVQSTNH